MVTATGRRVAPWALTADMVCIEDIVRATSKLCRFAGHGQRFYSVAAHQVLVCQLACVDHLEGSVVARCALLHDAVEAYVVDVPSPLKHHLPDYQRIEARAAQAICEAFNLPHPDAQVWDEVKYYDILAGYMEARLLFSPVPEWVGDIPARFLTSGVAPSICAPGPAEWLYRQELRSRGYLPPLEYVEDVCLPPQD